MNFSIIFSLLHLLLIFICGNYAQYLRHKPPRITYLHIQSDIKARFATTLVTSKVINPDTAAREVVFDVTIPDQAFISKFNLDIDGTQYPGYVQDKATAKRRYNSARRRGQSAGQISRRPRETNKFRVEVNVASQSIVIFNLTYEELLKRNKGLYKHVIYIDPGQVVDDLRVDVSIKETRPITNLNVPPITTDILQRDSTETNQEAVIVRPTPNAAEIDFRPSVEHQRQRSRQGLSGLFIVEYDIEREHDAGDMLVVDGYFVHFFAPQGLEPIPKDIVFVLDTSGSMGGIKIQQLKNAMERILSDLHQHDRFTVVTFASSLRYFRSSLIQATRQNVDAAKYFMRRIRAEGGTNINDGVLSAVRFIRNIADKETREGRSPVIVFLTDGQATSGETNNAKILKNVNEDNDFDIPIFSLAFGHDADYEFVRTMSVQNHGTAKKIYEASDSDLQISQFYDEVSVSLFRNVSFQYMGDNSSTNNITNTHFNTYFKGSEIVVAGLVDEKSIQNLDVSVEGDGSNGSLDFHSTDTQKSNDIPRDPNMSDEALSDEATNVFSNKKEAKGTIEKIWSHLTLKEILRELERESDEEQRAKLKKKVLDISLKYGIVTPLTSMVVNKPNTQELGDLQGDEADLRRPPPTLPPPGATTPDPKATQKDGKRGKKRGGGYGGGGDPHFMVSIPDVELPICFDIMAKAGQILRLLKDPITGLVINAATIPTKTLDRFGKPKTYIGEIFVKSKDIVLVVTPKQVIFNGDFLSWLDETPAHNGIVDMRVSDSGHILNVYLRKNLTVVIRRLVADENHPLPYLNIFIDNKNVLSHNTTGILGQFAHKHVKLKEVSEKNGKTIGHFRVRKDGKTVHFKTNLKTKHDFVNGETFRCWNAHRSITGLINGQLQKYIVQSFFGET